MRDTTDWNRTDADTLPQDKTYVEVITPSGQHQVMYYERGLWFLRDKSMYVYFTPTFWKEMSSGLLDV